MRCQRRHLLVARLEPIPHAHTHNSNSPSRSPHRAGPCGQHPQLPHPRGAPPWIFKDYSQPYVTPLTKTSLTLGISGGSFEKKFENMRGRKSIGYELGVDVVENLVFPQAVEAKLTQSFGERGWPPELPMPARKVSQVRFFRPRPSLYSNSNCNMAMRHIFLH